MTPYHVLIPMDGSVLSNHSLHHVCRLFEPQQCRVTLLRVAEHPASVLATPGQEPHQYGVGEMYDRMRSFEHVTHPIYANQIEQSLRAELEQSLRAAAHVLENNGFSVSVVVRFGDAATEIIRFAEASQVDVVAMTTHGRTGIVRFALGSVADRVLHTLTIPVLLARPQVETIGFPGRSREAIGADINGVEAAMPVP